MGKLGQRPEVCHACRVYRKRLESDSFLNQLEFTLEDDFNSPVGSKEWLGRSFQDAEIFSAPRTIWTRLSSVYHTDFNDMMFGPLPPEEHVLKTLEFLGVVISEFEKKRSRQM